MANDSGYNPLPEPMFPGNKIQVDVVFGDYYFTVYISIL